MATSVIVKLPHRTQTKGATPFMSNSITQDMKYRQSLMKYADKYGVLMHVYSIKWYDIIKIMKVKNVGGYRFNK